MNLTVKNYIEKVKSIDFSKQPEHMLDIHKKWSQFSKFYGKSDKITEMIDNHFNNCQIVLDSKPKPKTSTVKKVEDKKPAQKKETKKATAPKKSKGSKQAIRKQNEVPVMPLEVRFIKRYLTLHDKRVTEKQVSILYKAIQKASVEKTIRKSSKYADEIIKISKDLSQTYKEMNNSCKFEIPSSLHIKLKNITDSYGVTPAISLIKRFISLYGKITKEKANRLLKSIENSKKNGKVKSSDKAYNRVVEIENHLEKYLDSDKLFITDIQLNGLRGIAGLGK